MFESFVDIVLLVICCARVFSLDEQLCETLETQRCCYSTTDSFVDNIYTGVNQRQVICVVYSHCYFCFVILEEKICENVSRTIVRAIDNFTLNINSLIKQKSFPLCQSVKNFLFSCVHYLNFIQYFEGSATDNICLKTSNKLNI